MKGENYMRIKEILFLMLCGTVSGYAVDGVDNAKGFITTHESPREILFSESFDELLERISEGVLPANGNKDFIEKIEKDISETFYNEILKQKTDKLLGFYKNVKKTAVNFIVEQMSVPFCERASQLSDLELNALGLRSSQLSTSIASQEVFYKVNENTEKIFRENLVNYLYINFIIQKKL